jgi:hypothetical protein
MTNKPAEDTKLLLRLPAEVRQKVEAEAKREYRSLTSEILYLIDYALKAQEKSGGGEARA